MINYFLHWYSGALYSNIIADVLFALLGFLWGKRHIDKLHKRLDYQDAQAKSMHKHIIEVHQHLIKE